ncbi:uncharacterized protein LOC116338357 [Contarinia nasturtii]|uniref:uncharacterized protein LOC116338357 n=1 Tax=Contarinia nasturtii TaxID=265458 RepID=UPI0012D3F528|nr:uncharacterized protein LOC116338357 [Contarinia nasturtii]
MSMLPPFETFSVKNSIEFANELKNVQIQEDEVMVSFDVSALFPSIPLDHALVSLENHLRKHNVQSDHLNIYMETAKLCMKMNYFEYRKRYFKIESGTSMGNPLSPLIAEAFMSKLEMELKEKDFIPRFWKRYVDDIFAIVKRDNVNTLLEILNNLYEGVNFTLEVETDNSIVFLDLMVQRNRNWSLSQRNKHF